MDSVVNCINLIEVSFALTCCKLFLIIFEVLLCIEVFRALYWPFSSPSFWADFWPISLCNISNKILTKLLVLHLALLLPHIISPFQIGFVFGRVIHDDNVLLVKKLL